MPIGVEHSDMPGYKTMEALVFLPVMPIGVEHPLYHLRDYLGDYCVLTCDADRR